MAIDPRTDRNRPGAASVADPANAAMTGGMGGLFQMLMQFIQQLFGGAAGGLGSLFSGLTGNSSENAADGPVGGVSPGNGTSPNGMEMPGNPRFSSTEALRCAVSDTVRGAMCGRGVASILNDQGFRVSSDNGDQWAGNLSRNGWVKLEGVRPEDAPEGSVLTYNSDPRFRGQSGTGGRGFGHVEVVAIDESGDRRYVHAQVATRPGGTVPGNFTGAYVTREHYERIQAAHRRPDENRPNETAVARNDGSATGRNTSVAAAVDGQAIQAASLTTSFTDANQRRVASAVPAPQPNPAPAPAPALS